MIKKVLYLRFLLVIFALMANFPMLAHDIEVKNADGVTIYYIWTNNKAELAVTWAGDTKFVDDFYGNDDDYSGNVVIPESVEYEGRTYRVTSIGTYSFRNCSGLTSITIPSSVSSIGDEAFYLCSGLTTIVSEVEKKIFGIASSVFVGIPSDAELIVPKGTKALYQATEGWNQFKNVVEASGGDEPIPSPTDYSEQYLTFVAQESGTFSFRGTASDVVDNSVIYYSLDNGSSWTPLDRGFQTPTVLAGSKIMWKGYCVPVNYEYREYDEDHELSTFFVFGIGSFSSTGRFEVEGNFMSLLYGGDFIGKTTHDEKDWIFYGLFLGCSGLTSVVIPNSVSKISVSAFSGCSALTSVSIPNSVTSISSSAFQNCHDLTSIKVESGNPQYDSRDNCNAIIETSSYTLIFGCKNTVIPNSVTSIGDDAFRYCSGLTSITIPNSVTSIGDGAFSGCSGLTSITIPNSVTSIGENAFSGTGWYKNQPDGLVYAGKVAYKYKGTMPDNTSITIKDGTLGITGSAFSDCIGLISITIPNSVTSIGNWAFSRCSGLVSVTIPNSVISIGMSVFFGCSGLISLTISNSVTSVGARAFGGCSGLTSVTIPNSVTSIDNYTFSDCSGLTSITIPNSVTSIGYGAFDGTGWYNNQPDGLVYAGKVAYKYKGTIPENTSITIKDGTLGIGGGAFSRCSGLTSVTIPISVTSIGDGAFYGCSGLTSVTIPNSVTSVGARAFGGCSGLTSVTIPNSVTSIGSEAFYGCSGLTSVTIPNSVTSIGSNAFSGCSGLTSVTIPNSVTSIGYRAFYCSGLTSITIPNSVTSIGDGAFAWCSGLTSLMIPNSVTSIGEYAFFGCSGLTTIVSEIKKPFGIYTYPFSNDTYIVAELIVPYGTKAAYQATNGWKGFSMITEAADKDEANFAINGVTYQGTKSSKTVVVKAVDTKQMSVEIPASVSYDGTTYQVTGIADDAFKGSNMAALVWNVEAALPNNAFNNTSIGSNFLLYVKQASFAPSSIKNVIANGTVSSIVLSDDGGPFYCPQAFTARSISYTHNYSMETGGNGKGWETIALPFDVQKISHNTRGEIVPFPAYNSSSNQKPFWLGNMSASGFKRASSIQANEPYIIAMPNNSKYNNDYNLAGNVTFSAENVQVGKTPTYSGLFLPAFETVPQSSTVYALNVNNRNVKYSGNYDAGSRFIANLRDVRPFEAYMTGSSSTRGIIEINFDDGATDMLDILLPTDESQEVTIHTLSGLQITRTTQLDFDTVWQQLPKGVYIVNGKKLIK